MDLQNWSCPHNDGSGEIGLGKGKFYEVYADPSFLRAAAPPARRLAGSVCAELARPVWNQLPLITYLARPFEGAAMQKGAFVLILFTTVILGAISYPTVMFANSCSNVTIHGSFDESRINDNNYGISAAGTFRIEGETDESKQPLFNLTSLDCDKQSDDTNQLIAKCKLTSAVVWAKPDKPNTDDPNCLLDLEITEFSMKELSAGVLAGTGGDSTGCYTTMLTIDKNTERVYRAFSRTKSADKYDKISPGFCGLAPRTQVLMNCTPWTRFRKKGEASPRYCDFSSSSDK